MSTVKANLIDEGLNGFDLWESDNGFLFVTTAGTRDITGSAWGPAADGTGEWFASRWRVEGPAIRVADRQAAIEYITTDSGGR